MKIADFLNKLANLEAKVFLGIMLGMTGGYYYFILDDGSTIKASNQVLFNQLQKTRDLAKQAKKAEEQAENVKKQLDRLGIQYQEISSILPQNLPVSDVMRELQQFENMAGVDVKSQEPMEPNRKDNFIEMPFRISIDGTFSEITMFLYLISKADKLMRVGDFNMNLASDNMIRLDGIFTAYKFFENLEKIDDSKKKETNKKVKK